VPIRTQEKLVKIRAKNEEKQKRSQAYPLQSTIQQMKHQDQSENPDEWPWLRSLRESMGDHRLIVISNREPYIHQHRNREVEIIRPASGLVTALEPVLRQFGGLWIAHGSGSADLETTDAQGEIQVPPSQPAYTLRRVTLTEAEEVGYYYGFANEGLWPLCHLAHTRPIFRLGDWEQYQKVNHRFSAAVPIEPYGKSPLILIQDYHFALLPRLLKQRIMKYSQQPRIGIFWHIPWPNPEAFGICPWGQPLLNGMLGANVIGFHTQYHCNNFLETCNRYLEARIDWEKFSVTKDHHETLVRAFPIGIDPAPVRTLAKSEIQELKASYGIHADIVAVGVDRLDYTKGLLERIEAVERLLEKYPHYQGRLSLVQMGSPSRTHIPAYRTLANQLQSAVKKVNLKFGRDSGPRPYRPILFLSEHHEWAEIQYFYQMGDLCLVTSLHDGMNLVAKEYVWCQAPERGALVLSQFAGASRELTEAFIVNPYSTEELADSIAAAIELPSADRARRMLAMKDKIRSQNAFHWASSQIHALLTEPAAPSTILP
jgi:trehalose 6-phosphate synthase